MLYQRMGAAERQRRSGEVLECMGIAHRPRHLPQQLSGGQQQQWGKASLCSAKWI